MGTFSIVQQKLEQFIKKYYTNELIKGVIFFFAIGLLYLLLTLLVEYFLWLGPTGRAILFWAFVTVGAMLFARFIAFPFAGLFNLRHGLSHEAAANIIGKHFPQVSDKLLNVIQLNQNRDASELLAASIDQKAAELRPVPFKRAVNFKQNVKYLKYAAIPVAVFLLASVLGGTSIFSSSYERVVNYGTAYSPPAPFRFVVLNKDLKSVENKAYTLKVRTDGNVVPEHVKITFNGGSYYLQQLSPGLFEYTFAQPTEDIRFRLKANTVTSAPYGLSVVKTPSIIGFEMFLDYPNYTGKRDETLKGTGNATVPEGTRVVWGVSAKNTETVHLRTKDTARAFASKKNNFTLQKKIYRNLDYAITTSNSALRDYENLSFALRAIKDEHPEISVRSKKDSTSTQQTYFYGRVSDDYGLTKLNVVYYPLGEENAPKTLPLTIGKGTVDEFVHTFPGQLPLTAGTSYEYYFEVFDNDAPHRFKSSRSAVYSFRKLTKDELENEQLKDQSGYIEGINKTLEQMKAQEKSLEELSNTQKEKKQLNWTDKKKISDFIKRQQQQEEMMKNFSRELKENLQNFQPENEAEDPFKEQLEKRLEENEKRLGENEKLLKELEKLQEKINKEDFTEKLEKLSKQNKNQEKNLEQLLELTKRYYVAKKAEKLAEQIVKLGEEQEKQADAPKEENTTEQQQKLNEKFDEFKKQLEELKQENQQLKAPMDIPQDKTGEKQVDEQQQKATDNLKQQKQEGAKQNQKKAGQKMKQMGQQMQQQMQASQQQTIDEDTEMLRQILDNLVVFSFEQETVMHRFKTTDYGNPVFGKRLNRQNDLKLNFQHIDDSLFALSLRQPLIGDIINENITDVAYNIDKSMERLAENRMRQGISNQQYAVTGANKLAVLLSDMLFNMQQQMMGPGKGQGEGRGFQLPDIIQKQGELSEEMKKGMGKKPGEGKDGNGKEGEEGKKGEGQQGNGEGQGNTKDGKGNGGDGEGYNEDLNGKLYEIYKQQQPVILMETTEINMKYYLLHLVSSITIRYLDLMLIHIN
ncbi:MAG: DUF4175 family protein, partial [Marinirhabdus sp.]